MQVRALRPDDPAEVEAWLDLRVRLWPESSREEHAADRELVLGDPARSAVLVAHDDAQRLVGFVEVALRAWAEGCAARPVGYLEGWYVEPDQRRRGIGRLLVAAAESWVLARGVSEMASDADPENATSLAAHARLGYREVGRAVLFARQLDGDVQVALPYGTASS